MSELLYLDTARLGQMSPSARRASVDFARFASEYGCSLYLNQFLENGFDAWPAALRDQFPGLQDWHGVTPLKERLRLLAEARSDANVLIAARSASLMKIGARLLFARCRRVLITDLTWGSYERILHHEQPQRARSLTKIALRGDVFRHRLSNEEIVSRIATAYRESQCDGVFLPLVDCFGVKLPVAQVVERIRAETELRFVVVDGAQAINHVALGLHADYCDIMLAGCHKWLCSFMPMGVGFYGRPKTVDYIQSSLSRWQKRGIIDDPLISFSDELETGIGRRFGESVGVSPMIVANSAVADATNTPDRIDMVDENQWLIAEVATSNSNWKLLSPGSDASTRIMMLRSCAPEHRCLSPSEIRDNFHAAGVAVSTYRGARVRISVPSHKLGREDLRRLQLAFGQTEYEIPYSRMSHSSVTSSAETQQRFCSPSTVNFPKSQLP